MIYLISGPSPPHPPFGHLLLKEKEKGNEVLFKGARLLFINQLMN
jgi:hypothetical protein